MLQGLQLIFMISNIKHMSNKYKEDLLEALNRMDELIEEMGMAPEEKAQQAKDYLMLYRFIEGRL